MTLKKVTYGLWIAYDTMLVYYWWHVTTLTLKELCNLLRICCKTSLVGKIHFLNIYPDMHRDTDQSIDSGHFCVVELRWVLLSLHLYIYIWIHINFFTLTI